MSRFTVHSKSTSLGLGPDGPPPPPPPPVMMMMGGSTGPAVTVMVTSTMSPWPLASPLPSSAVTVTAYVVLRRGDIEGDSQWPTVIWPLSASMLNEPESAPERR